MFELQILNTLLQSSSLDIVYIIQEIKIMVRVYNFSTYTKKTILSMQITICYTIMA